MPSHTRPLAVITGASSGIGYELAKCCARDGYDLVIASDDRAIADAAAVFRALGSDVAAVRTNLATRDGVDELCTAIDGRHVDALLANAEHGLGQAFFDQDFDEIHHVVETNVTGTIYLVHKIGRAMRTRGHGRILITGSVAGFTPGTYHAVYNGTKAFIDSFSWALRAELQDTGVTVTCLMPGATETDFFERAGMANIKVGTDTKDDPAAVAKTGYAAMIRGDGMIVAGLKNKIRTAIVRVTSASMLAEQQGKRAEPGSGC